MLENSLFWGQDTGAASTEYVEWAGLDKLLGGGPNTGGTGAGNTYDLRGTTFSSTPFTTIVNDLAQTVVDNFGFPTDIYLPFPVLAKINEEFAGTAAQRVILPTASGNTQVNINIDGLMTQAGRVNLKPTFFLNKTRTAVSQGVLTGAGTQTPLAIGSAAVTMSAAGTPTTGYSVAAGAYEGSISFRNKFGESVLVANGAGPITTSGSNTLRFAVTNTPADAQFIDFFITEAGDSAGTKYWVQTTPLTATGTIGAGDGNYDYTGVRMPNTYTAFIGQMTPDVLTFRQLAPLVKMDLATIAPAYKWMIQSH